MITADRAGLGPPLDAARLAPDTAEWPVWSTTARIVVTDPAALPDAYERTCDLLADVDRAASRFRTDSEISALDRSGGAATAVSWLLEDLIGVALDAARHTDGDVDPCLGRGMRALGYDRDFALLASGPASIALGGPARTAGPATARGVTVRHAPGWRDIVLEDGWVRVPSGVSLDLGATAKAFASDLIARTVVEECDTGILVSLGGDIATAGPGPDGGWRILVSDGPDQPSATVVVPAGAAVATSSTLRRRWIHDGVRVHHILDPRTGRPAEPLWRTVTVACNTCVLANTLTTAAVVRGAGALPFLRAQQVPARLVRADGEVAVLGGWPAEP